MSSADKVLGYDAAQCCVCDHRRAPAYEINNFINFLIDCRAKQASKKKNKLEKPYRSAFVRMYDENMMMR